MRERDLFIEALQKDTAAERSAHLDAACAGNAELRLRVERLLEEHDRNESFILDAPPPGIEATLLTTSSERPGMQIGPYKLLQQIGEGGMGVVFLAEQTEPVARRVALKIVKPGMDSRQVIARFDAERHALAVLDHPNIARVLDAGTTSSGRPYFVMELVKGEPITNYCDDHHLTPRERLELFIPVCEAVQHAHQKGIIHRDLKPSNVLIALYDGKPVPKVIDFGVAKATGPKLTDQTLFTEFGSIVGTLEYMSPEQADLNQLDIDTRSDIYSLGVLLYELLTGTTPLQRKELKDSAVLEMLRKIREDEPPNPSARLTSTEELPSIAAHRGLEPKRLSGLVRGELDWIVMKCLEKERGRRYETANGLAMDVKRYLADEPVLACPPSRIYRLRKFTRRNKAALVVSTVLGASLIAGTFVSTWQAIRAEAARRDADAQRQLAENNLQKARQVVDEYFTLVSESTLLDVPGLQSLRKQLLEAALRYHEGFARQESNDPQMLAELASSYLRVSVIENAIARNDDAVAAFEQALPIVERLRQDFPDAAEQHRVLAGFWKGNRTSRIRSTVPKDPRKARRVLEKFAEIWEAFIRENPTVTGFQSDLIALYGLQASLLGGIGQHADSIAFLEKSVGIGENLVRENPELPEYRVDLSRTYDLLAAAMKAVGKRQESERLQIRMLELSQQAATHHAGAAQHKVDYARNLELLAGRLSARGDTTLAEKTLNQSVEIFQKLIEEHPDVPLYYERQLRVQSGLARLYSSTRRPEQAKDLLRSRWKARLSLLSKHADHEEWDFVLDISDSIRPLFNLLRTERREAEAETAIRESIDRLHQLANEAGGKPKFAARIAQAQRGYAEFLARELKRPNDGIEVSHHAIKQMERTLAASPENLDTQLELAHCHHEFADILRGSGRADEADLNYRRALALKEEVVAAAPANSEYRFHLGRTLFALGDLLNATNNAQEAEKLYSQAVVLFEKLTAEFPGDPQWPEQVAHSHRLQAFALLNLGRQGEAENSFRKAIGVLEKSSSAFPASRNLRHYQADTWRQIGSILNANHRSDEAEEALRRAVDIYMELQAQLPGNLVNTSEVAASFTDLAAFLSAHGRSEKLEELLSQVRKFHANDPRSLHSSGLTFYDAGAHAAAELYYRAALAAYGEASGDQRADVARCQYDLARALYEQDKYAEAEQQCRRGVVLRRALHGDSEERLAGDLVLLAVLFQKQGKPFSQFQQEIPDAQTIWSRQTAQYLNGVAWNLAANANPRYRNGAVAVALAKTAVARAPNEGYIVNTLGTAYYRAGEWKAAIEALKEADELYQGQFFSSDAFFIAMSHWQLGEKETARKWFDAALSWMNTFAVDNQEQHRFRDEAASLLELPPAASAGIEKGARDLRDLCTLILDAWPDARWAYLRRAQAHENAGDSAKAQDDYRRALDLCEQAIQHNPQSARLSVVRASAYAQLSQWGKTASDLDKAVELGAGPEIAYQAALAHLGANHVSGYRQDCGRLIQQFDKLGSNDPPPLALWACAVGPEAALDLAPVVALAEKAVQKNSAALQLQSTLGALLYRTGRYQDALQRLQQADQLVQQGDVSTPPAYTWFFMAMANSRLGHRDQAVEWLKKAVEGAEKALGDHAAGTAILSWNRRLTLNLLRKEAEALLGANEHKA